MATPMAGEGPIAAAIPRSPPPPAAGGCGGGSAAEAPVLIFVYFHKAIRAELERMHAAAVRLATAGPASGGGGGGVAALEARCCFLFAVYRHHCHAEDAVRAVRAQRRRRFCCLSLHFCFAGLVLRSSRLRVTSLRNCAGWEEARRGGFRSCAIDTKVGRIWFGSG